MFEGCRESSFQLKVPPISSSHSIVQREEKNAHLASDPPNNLPAPLVDRQGLEDALFRQRNTSETLDSAMQTPLSFPVASALLHT
jgi:hypothetical protein